jgi:MFS family permease
MQIRDASQLHLLYLQVFFFGIGMGARLPLMSSLIADIFQGAHYGSIMGVMALGEGIGGTIGPLMSGYLFDRTGSYMLSFSIAIVTLACSCLCVWVAKWTHEKSTQHR